MTALTSDRATPSRAALVLSDPAAAGALIFAGAMYALDGSGNAVKATAGGGEVRGVAQFQVDNTGGAAGAQRVEGRRGCWRYGNSSGAGELTRADIGSACYVADDQTVSKTGTAFAGTVHDIEAGEVWVEIGVAPPAA